MKAKDEKTTLADLKRLVAGFVKARDWEQFHSPKNLSMSIAIEAAELMEHFQWHDKNEDAKHFRAKRKDIEDELSDIFAYLLSFANLYQVDLSSALQKKIIQNGKKYPVHKAKGKAKKYTEL